MSKISKKPNSKTKSKKRLTKKKPKTSASKGKSPISRKLLWLKRFLVLGIWGSVAFAGVLLWFVWDIPNPDDVIETASRKPSITLLDRAGEEILRTGDVHGNVISIKDLPVHVMHAVLATEDRRFYDHMGVDIIGLLRAAWTNFRAGGIRQGGSTLTQQLAKNLFLTREKTIRRKVQEVFLAFWLEKRFSKDQLLSLYLNRVYLGSGVYGIDAAARKFFGKPANHLSLYEAAVIAGLPKAPSRYNPIASPERAAVRANQVLENMVGAGWLSTDHANKLKRKKVVVTGVSSRGQNLRYFTNWVRGRIAGYLGHINQDLVVKTTFDLRHQKIAEKHINDIKQKMKTRKADAIAFLALKPDGAVTAMMGGYSWNKSPFNRATQAFRQPGSAFKPVVFLAGIEAGLKPDSQVDDREITVEGWSPRNASGEHRGQMTLREGAARSSNSVAVAVSELAGRTAVLQMARRLGISSTLHSDPAIALGVYESNLLEMTGAYAVFANGGYSVTPYGILRIENKAGDILYSRDNAPRERMVEARYIKDLNKLLEAVVSWGTGKKARLDRPAAGKTGTSQHYRDAWFIGYTAPLVAGVWMGNDNAAPTDNVTGGNYPAQLWKLFMRDALTGIAPEGLK